MTAPRDKVLAALEQVCRREAEVYAGLMKYCENDLHASRYGAGTPQIARLAGVGITMAQVRRVLHAEVEAGRVLLYKPYPRTISWWPVGLWEKLQAEKAAATGEGDANAA